MKLAISLSLTRTKGEILYPDPGLIFVRDAIVPNSKLALVKARFKRMLTLPVGNLGNPYLNALRGVDR